MDPTTALQLDSKVVDEMQKIISSRPYGNGWELKPNLGEGVVIVTFDNPQTVARREVLSVAVPRDILFGRANVTCQISDGTSLTLSTTPEIVENLYEFALAQFAEHTKRSLPE